MPTVNQLLRLAAVLALAATSLTGCNGKSPFGSGGVRFKMRDANGNPLPSRPVSSVNLYLFADAPGGRVVVVFGDGNVIEAKIDRDDAEKLVTTKSVELVFSDGSTVTQSVTVHYSNQVKPAGSPGDAKREAEVIKMNQCLAAYRKKSEAATKYWNDHIDDNEFDRRPVIRECMKLAKEIDPFSPPGVNPELSDAIRKVKDAYDAFHSAALEDEDRRFTAKQQEPFRQALSRAKDDLDAVVNRLQAKYNQP